MKQIIIYGLFCLGLLPNLLFAQTPRGSVAAPFSILDIEKELVKVEDSLLASQYEVTNLAYANFLQTVSKTSALYKKVQIDSTGWKKCVNNMQELNAYHRHAAFANYPVVNISFEAAEAYCKWLTDTYNQTTGRKYKQVLFRLPTEIEWESAARSGKTDGMYAWEGFEIMDSKGNYVCNFGDLLLMSTANARHSKKHTNATASDHHIITAPVSAYKPNALGLFNMCGNAAEMTLEKGYSKGGSWYSKREKLEINQSETYQNTEPFLGFRVFMKIVKM